MPSAERRQKKVVWVEGRWKEACGKGGSLIEDQRVHSRITLGRRKGWDLLGEGMMMQDMGMWEC